MNIKSTPKESLLLLAVVIVLLLFSSCRKEETESIQTPEEETLGANSITASLIQRTVTKDGSNDNILDNANCFTIVFPLTVVANGEQVTVNSENDLETVEDVFDEFDNDIDNLDLIFPISVTQADYSEITINTLSEFETLSSTCSNENEVDDDIECIDFEYPISVSSFNSNSELLETLTITNDNFLYDFIEDLNTENIVTINFPVTLIAYDDTQIIVNNISELENTIIAYQNSCDEDDDYDFDDDDCDDCTEEILIDKLVNCSDWIVNRLKRNDMDFDDVYDNYSFNFFNDGSIFVTWGSSNASGTWTTNGTANNISVVINIPVLTLCNNNWILHEIDEDLSETEIDLRLGDQDRLRYENGCD